MIKRIKIKLDELEKCKNLDDVFAIMGIGVGKHEKDPGLVHLSDKEIFGEKGYYANMAISQETYEAISEHLKPLGEPWYTRRGGRRPSKYALQWMNYSPVSVGPRYEAIEKRVGEIKKDELYIILPDDELYEEEPGVKRARRHPND